MDPPNPVPGQADGFQLAAVDADTIAGNFGSALLGLQIAYMGDGLAELGGPFQLFSVGMAPLPEMKIGITAAHNALRAAIAGDATGRETPNFSERGGDPARLWTAERLACLQAVKRAIDPENLVRSNHPVI
jgi:hypothetical protein